MGSRRACPDRIGTLQLANENSDLNFDCERIYCDSVLMAKTSRVVILLVACGVFASATLGMTRLSFGQNEQVVEAFDPVVDDTVNPGAAPTNDVERLELAIQGGDPAVAWMMRYAIVERARLARECDLTAEQIAAFEKIDLKWITAAVEETQEIKAVVNGGIFGGIRQLFGGPNPARRAQNSPLESVKQVTKQVDAKLRRALTEEQIVAYDAAVEEMAKFEASTSADVLIQTISGTVYLSEEQRVKLHAVLLTWLADNPISAMTYSNNKQFFPHHIPGYLLSEVLNAKQMQGLASLQRTQFLAIQNELHLLTSAPAIVIEASIAK